ncbi:hypothetical protein [Salinicola acroporae]|uniref:hypothetical protein n=1 Tax=Salinicola acroporae TaxID=1541440 RepID=UPI001F0BD4CF|nr:hypothetical protein [Salinicola acroporae]
MSGLLLERDLDIDGRYAKLGFYLAEKRLDQRLLRLLGAPLHHVDFDDRVSRCSIVGEIEILCVQRHEPMGTLARRYPENILHAAMNDIRKLRLDRIQGLLDAINDNHAKPQKIFI